MMATYYEYQLGMENATKILRPAGDLWAILVPIGAAVVSAIIYILKRRKDDTPICHCKME